MASQNVARSATQQGERATNPPSQGEGDLQQPLQDLVAYCRNYAREQPEMAALWCFGVGFVLGWKLKPW